MEFASKLAPTKAPPGCSLPVSWCSTLSPAEAAITASSSACSVASLSKMVLNLKTAKALGLTIRQSVLVRADREIE